MKEIYHKIKYVGILTGALLLLGLSTKLFNKDNFPKINDEFRHDNYKEYFMESRVLDINKDNYPDCIQAIYDLNKDGQPDVSAFYKIIGVQRGNLITPKTANIVVVDKKPGLPVDYMLMDEDNNGTLEKKVKNPEMNQGIIKEQKIPQKKRDYKLI